LTLAGSDLTACLLGLAVESLLGQQVSSASSMQAPLVANRVQRDTAFADHYVLSASSVLRQQFAGTRGGIRLNIAQAW